MKKLLSILTLGLCVHFTNAQQVYVADSARQIHDLRPFTSVWIDPTNQLTLQEISGKADGFIPLQDTSELAQPYITYWLRIQIKPEKDINNWWLMFGRPNYQPEAGSHGTIDAWMIAGGKTTHQRSGFSVAGSEKAIKDKPGIERIPFSAKAGETTTVYLKIFNEYGPGVMGHPQLRDPAIGMPEYADSLLLYIISFIALAFCVMSLFFYFFVREKAYLFFGLYTLFLSQHYLILHPENPFINIYLPEHGGWAVPAFYFITSCNLMLFLLFGRYFINLPSLSRKTDQGLLWFVRIAILTIAAMTLYMGITHTLVVNRLVTFLLFGSVLFFIVRFTFFKTILARFFVAGALWLLCFSLLGVMWNGNTDFLPFNPWPVGQMGQLVIYAAGLAYKLRQNEKARAEAEQIKNLDEIKSKFFANISHEFRTPLTLIQGPLQQIEDVVPEKEKQVGSVNVPWRQIRTMRRHTDRLLELVNQLLDLSRLDSGKMKLNIIKGDVMQMLKVLTGSFQSMAERKSIHYQVHFPDKTVIGFFDKDKLDKIVVNLLGNAFKYTPEQGTVSVTITTEENRLRIAVEDTGAGISKKELDKVFDRFYQVEGTEDKGSGIGLALVKELVDLYRGQITVSSEPGKGSSFRVSLPVDKNSFKEDEFVYGEWKPEESGLTISDPGGEEKLVVATTNSPDMPLLLVVEDNPDLRAFIRETVEGNFNVIESVNGKEGLEKAIAEVPDIIVSDVMMPVLDGFEMTERLKKDERTSHIPVILLTAKAGQSHKLEGLQTGADDYLTKPFDGSELRTRIQNLVNQRKLLRKKFAGDIILKPSEVSVKSTDDVFLSKVMAAIEKNIGEENFGVEELAREVAMSRSQLHRKLVALTNQSASEVLRNTRLLRAKELLQKKAATPSEVAYQVGFNSHTYFSKCFKEEFGVSPSEITPSTTLPNSP